MLPRDSLQLRQSQLGSAPSLPYGAELFSVTNQSGKSASDCDVIVCGEEKGGTDALIPVIHQLLARNVSITALVAGVGRGILTQDGDKHGLHLTRVARFPDPAALLFSASNDGRLEEYLSTAYEGVDSFMLEDHYESSRYAIDRTSRNGLRVPTVFTIDSEATRLIGCRFPGLSVLTVETGSPAFDHLHGEDRLAIQRQVKQALGITTEKLVTVVLPGLDHTALASEIADVCRTIDGDIIFAIRRHPRDSVDQKTIDDMFAGVRSVDTRAYDSITIGAASDLVVAQRSTHSLYAVIRQQPTICMAQYVPDGFTLPLVDAHASLLAEPAELPAAIYELLEGSSVRCHTLRSNMSRYRVDGRAAERVANIITRSLQSGRKLEPVLQQSSLSTESLCYSTTPSGQTPGT